MKDSLFKKSLLRIYRKISKEKYRLEEKYTNVYVRYCRIKSKKVVFDNFGGKGYGDNPKYIAEEILQQNLKWDLVWLANDINDEFPKGIRVVQYGSLKARRELASAKVWIDNIRNSERPPKKQKQIYLQTWHGGFAIKKVEKAAEESLNKEYVTCAQKDGFETDGIISACEVQTKDYLENFWLNGKTEVLKIGQPRNDVMFIKDKEVMSYKVKNRFGILNETKIILYTPTFRDDFEVECYNIEPQKIINAFERKIGGLFVMFVRLHPNAQGQAKYLVYNDKVINATTYPDIQELYLAADYLITDYSSAAFDFSLLRRPVFLYVPDYEKYENLRGLNLRLEETPFILARTNEELVDKISDFSMEDYWKNFERFKEKFWKPYDNGTASKQAVQWIQKTNLTK